MRKLFQKLQLVSAYGALGYLAFALIPTFLHAADLGEDRLDVAKLYSGYEPSSRNLVLAGVLALDQRATVSHRNRKGTVSTTYIPVVPKGWSPKDPVRVVMATGNHWAEVAGPSAQPREEWQCTLRNLAWEGLPPDAVSALQGIGLVVAADARMVTPDGPNRVFAAICLAVLVLATTGLTLLLVRKRRAAT